MKNSKLLNELFQWGALTALVVMAMPGFALAQTGDVNELVTNAAKNQLTVLPYILSTVAYVGGAFMIVSGALKLKAHAENPAQEKLAPGVARLLIGGLITAVPALVGILQRTAGANSMAGSQYNNFAVTF